MSEQPGDTLRDQMDRDPAKQRETHKLNDGPAHPSGACCDKVTDLLGERADLAKRIWSLNDQVKDLKDLLHEVRANYLPSETEIMDYAATNEGRSGGPGGVLVRRIEAALARVE